MSSEKSKEELLFELQELRKENESLKIAYQNDIIERKKSEVELRKSETMLKRAHIISRFGNWEWDFITNELYWDEENYKIHGIDPQIVQPSYQAFIDLVDPSEHEFVNKSVTDAIAGNCLFDIDYSITRPDNGEKCVINSKAEVIFDSTGKVLKMIGTIQDISERKQAEKTLKQSEAQKNAILNGITTNIAFVDKDLKILWANKTAAESIYKTPDEMTGHTCYSFWGNPEQPCKDCPAIRAIQTKKSEHTIIHTPDGRIWDERGEPIFDEAGDLIGVIEIAQDITERKLAEALLLKQNHELEKQYEDYMQLNEVLRQSNYNLVIAKEKAEESENKFRDILDNTKFHLWAFDGTYYTYCNKNWYDYTGQDFNSPLTIELWASVVHPDDIDKSTEIWISNWESKTEHDNYFRLKRYDGVYRYFYCHAVPVYDKNGNFKQFQGYNIDITVQRFAEDSLRESEEKKSAILKAIPDMMFVQNNEGKYIEYHAPDSSLHYSSPEYFLGKKFDEVLPIELVKEFEYYYNIALKTKQIQMFEYSLQINDEINYFELRMAAYQEDKILSIIRDITKRKSDEADLQKSIELYNSILKASPDNIAVTDMSGRLIMFSPIGFKMFGYNLNDEYYGRVVTDFIIPDDRERAISNIVLIQQGVFLGTEEYRGLRKDGSTFDIEINGEIVRSTEGEATKMVFIVRDITERNLAEKALRESEERSSTIVNSSPNLVFIHINGIIQYINNIGVSMFGYSKEEAIGKSIIDFLSEESKLKVIANMQRRIAGEVIQPYEANIVTKSGIIKTMLVQGATIPFNNKNASLAVLADISLIKEYEKNLEIALKHAEESDRLKTAFLQNLSHEIRTPLNGIIGFSKLLQYEDNSQEEINEYTSLIDQSGKRLLETVNNVLDISKIETGHIKVNNKSFSINSLITDLYSSFLADSNLKGIKLNYKTSLNDENSIIFSDESKLNQILTNLISNALKFSYNGNIDFGYEIIVQPSEGFKPSQGYIDAKPSEGSNTIQFFVKDTGIGISTNLHDRVFERFTQAEDTVGRSFEGAGLGLAICKGLVKLLGGKIWLESEINKGTTFFFTLPYKAAAFSAQSVNENSGIPLKFKNVKILIADDDYVSLKYLKNDLKNIDCDLVLTENGEQTVELVKQIPDIDMIFMDLRMPIMDGFEATKLIKKFRPELPIIAQTAYALSAEKEMIMLAGFDDYISKPLDRNKILKLVEKYLG
jgi:PAS domain S-box-containing protein